MARYQGSVAVLFCLFLGFVPLSTEAQAQPRRVEGRVVDASNEASLPFTNVAIVGSQRGTTTNENGRFLLAVDSLPVRLAISYVGYQRVERRVTPSTADSVVVRLKEKPVSMAEVVVEERTGAYFTRKPLPRLAYEVCARPPLNHHLRHGNRFFLQSDNRRIRSARGHPSFHPLVPDVADGESNGEGVDGQQKSAVFVGRRAPLTSDNRYVRERERRFVRGINNSPLDSTWLSPNVST